MSDQSKPEEPFFEWRIRQDVAVRVCTLITEDIEGCQMDPQEPFTKALRSLMHELRVRSTQWSKPLEKPNQKYYTKESPRSLRPKYQGKRKKWSNGPLANPAPIPPWFGGSEIEEKKPDHIADNLLAVLEMADPREDL
jgi:hypothetical protein